MWAHSSSKQEWGLARATAKELENAAHINLTDADKDLIKIIDKIVDLQSNRAKKQDNILLTIWDILNFRHFHRKSQAKNRHEGMKKTYCRTDRRRAEKLNNTAQGWAWQTLVHNRPLEAWATQNGCRACQATPSTLALESLSTKHGLLRLYLYLTRIVGIKVIIRQDRYHWYHKISTHILAISIMNIIELFLDYYQQVLINWLINTV